MILLGDCLERLKELEDNSVDSVVCDPPYGISFMSKRWDYDVPKVEVWREVLRVLKPGGHALIACGTRTQHRMTVNIEDAGFEIRDVVTWLYGSGFPKSLDISKAIDKAAGAKREVVGTVEHHDIRNGSLVGKVGKVETNITAPSTDAAKQWQGWGTALKPACEFWTLARKPLSESTVAKNVLKWGVGGLNIDESRIGVADNEPNKRKETGGYNSGESLATVPNAPYNSTRDATLTQGRWPANLILGEISAALLDEQSGALISKWGKQKSKHAGDKSMFGLGVPDNVNKFSGDAGGASRFFYVAKASKRERNAGLEGMPEIEIEISGQGAACPKFTKDGKPNHSIKNQNHHPTVKPIKLMEYLIKLITPPNGTVLDPFMGSGSTGVAAFKNGFKFIGIEMSAEYVEIAKKRIEHESLSALG